MYLFREGDLSYISSILYYEYIINENGWIKVPKIGVA
jgi:hypothetical protein